MVQQRWSFRPRRHVYLVGAAGLIAAAGWIPYEPLASASQQLPAGASGAYAQPETHPQLDLTQDASAALSVQRAGPPRLLPQALGAPAGGSVERRLAALVQAPKHGPPR